MILALVTLALMTLALATMVLMTPSWTRDREHGNTDQIPLMYGLSGVYCVQSGCLCCGGIKVF